MMESTVKQRLMAFLEYKKVGQSKFESMCELSRGYLTNLRTSPGGEQLKKIKDTCPELNLDWLITGDGKMLLTEDFRTNNIVVSTGDGNNNNAGGSQSISDSQELISELRKQLEQKDKEIEFLRNLVNTLTTK